VHSFKYSDDSGGILDMRFITIKLPKFISVIVVACASVFKGKKD